MRKNKKLIPKGDYCYSIPEGKPFEDRVLCIYWSIDKTKSEQANGYCKYMVKGDWDINKEKNWCLLLEDDTWGPQQSADELGITGSLIWDEVKECGVNI